MDLTLVTHPPAPRTFTFPDGTVVRGLPDDPSWEDESAPLSWPAGIMLHRLTLLSADGLTVPVTIVPHIPETHTDLPGWTITPGTVLPTAVEYPLARPTPLTVVLRARAHGEERVALSLRWESVPA